MGRLWQAAHPTNQAQYTDDIDEEAALIQGLKFLARRAAGTGSRLALRSRVAWTYRLWGLQGIDRLLRFSPSVYIETILTQFGAIVGANCDLNAPLLIHNAVGDYGHLVIGDLCHLGKDVFLDLRDRITLEDRVTISMRATILTHTDVGHSPLCDGPFPPRQSEVRIRRGAYVGAGATILQGATIGECSVVGAGAVVTKDVPDYSVVVGVPAYVVRRIPQNTVESLAREGV